MGLCHHRFPDSRSSFIFILLIISVLPFTFASLQQNHTSEKIQTIVILGEANYKYEDTVNHTVQFIYQFTFNSSSYGKNGDIRVHSECSDDQSMNFPVTFVVRQQQNVLSWQLPQVSKSSPGVIYFKSSRTLCDAGVYDDEAEEVLFVTISTASIQNVRFSLNVSAEQSFVMTLGSVYNTSLSPPSPRFYRFIFSMSENDTFPASISSQYVLLEVFSEDLTCMTVSVQNASCPVLDEESNVQFVGYWQTMSKKAGMTLRRDIFPNGFYLVFVMHSDDTRCRSHDGNKLQSNFRERRKRISFSITEKITYVEYLIAIFGLIGFFFMFYILAFMIHICHSCRTTVVLQLPVNSTTNNNTGNEDDNGNQADITSDPIPGGSGIQNRIGIVVTSDVGHGHDVAKSESQHWLMDSDSSLDETEIDMLDDAVRDKDIFRTTTSLRVSALARKNPRVLAKKSQLYLWTLTTVAIFYSIPVLQLVFTYQHVLHTTGNTDLCYYNYLCSHPFWILSDFNHVYSNCGYILLGILFLLLVYRRDCLHHRRIIPNEDINIELRGIPRHFGLFYSMGLALVMEGVLSACYHVCPNGSNFQFDTCFMYVISLMCILKIYQTRHPDINASAYATFAALAFVVLIGVLGVMAGNIYFWGLFTALHVLVCLFLSFQIYYMGRWKMGKLYLTNSFYISGIDYTDQTTDSWQFDLCDGFLGGYVMSLNPLNLDGGLFRRVYGRWKNDCLASPLSCLRPLYIERMILLVFANGANWAIAAYGIINQSPDFASHLLLIFMSNLFIYTLFYIIMKLTHGEKILFQPLCYIVLTCIFWSLGLWIFLQKSTSWQTSPAESRTFNRECIILRFYDTHDIWHVVSAIGLFVWYMVLLTLDDDLIDTPRDGIAVF